jgi:hypothetical protein
LGRKRSSYLRYCWSIPRDRIRNTRWRLHRMGHRRLQQCSLVRLCWIYYGRASDWRVHGKFRRRC